MRVPDKRGLDDVIVVRIAASEHLMLQRDERFRVAAQY